MYSTTLVVISLLLALGIAPQAWAEDEAAAPEATPAREAADAVEPPADPASADEPQADGAPAGEAEDDTADTEEAAPEGSAAMATVAGLHETLLSAMRQADELGYQGRYELLEPRLRQTYDFEFMGEKAAGRHWRQFDETQRATWLAAFERLLLANYAGRFDGYSGQSFETGGEEDAGHDTLLVRTTLINPDGDDVQLNYRLRQTDDAWRVIDVYMHGTVSELALRRAEYSTAFERQGFDQVIAELDSTITSLAAEDSAAPPPDTVSP